MIEHGLQEANVPTLPGFLDCLSPITVLYKPCFVTLGIKLALALTNETLTSGVR